jgi:hypothetical protein
MAKQAVLYGTLSIDSAVVAELEEVTISATTQTISGAAIEDTHPETFVGASEFRITATAFSTAATAQPFFALPGTTVTVIVLSQDNSTVVFEGSCIVEGASDVQRQGDLERQTITLVSAGEPTTP